MKFSKQRSRHGFTLIEVLIATTMVSVMLVSLLGILTFSRQAKVSAEIRQETAFYAHHRAMLFSKGLIYSDVFSAPVAGGVVHQLELEPLPGGFPFRKAVETITLSADGRSATLAIDYEVESAREKPVKFQASMVRYR